jgi:hypothetical protein
MDPHETQAGSASASTGNGVGVAASGSSPAVDAAHAQAYGENLRQIRLGQLLVGLGVAAEQEVFPNGFRSPTGPPPLQVVPASAEPPAGKWTTAFASTLSGLFFSSKPAAPSTPQEKAKKAAATVVARKAKQEEQKSAKASTNTSAAPQANLAAEAASSLANVSTEKESSSAAAESAPHQQTDATTNHPENLLAPSLDAFHSEDKLHPNVKEARARLLNNEKVLHETLGAIEKSKRAYLVASKKSECNKEMELVAKCYEQANQAERQLYSAIQTAKKKQGSSGDPNEVSAAFSQHLLIAPSLRCAPVVEKLKFCADSIADRHAKTTLRLHE